MGKCIYIVVMRPNTIVSKGIRFATNDEYTHASLSLDKDLTQMYSFSRSFSHYPFMGQFKHEQLHKGFFKNYTYLPGVILEVPVTQEQYDNITSILDVFIQNSNEYRYNYAGLFFTYFNKEFLHEKRFLCSEFVYHVLHNSGLIDFHCPRNLVRPKDFLSLDFPVVFHGNLKAYAPEPALYPQKASPIQQIKSVFTSF